MTNKEKFRETYIVTLTKAHKRKPEEYGYKEDYIPVVVDRMIVALSNGTANIGNSIQNAACRLNVKPTAKAIKEFLNADN